MDNRVLQIVLQARDEASGVLQKSGNIISRSLENAQGASLAFAGGLSLAGTAAAGFIGFGAKMAGDLEAARQGFVALLGSTEEADATIKRIKKEAAATPFELPGLVAGTQALAAVTKDGNKAIDVLLSVGKAVATSGKGQAELDSIVVNLQQIASTGKVEMFDVKQMQRAIPMFNDILAASDLTVEKLQNSENAAELLFGAFEKAGKEGGITAQGFAAQAGTFNQLVSNLKDSFGIMMSDIVKDSGIFDLLKDSIAGLVDFMNAHKEDIVKFIKDGIGFIKDYGPIIVGIIVGGLVPAMFAFVGAIIAGTVALAPWLLAGAAVGLLAIVIMKNWGPISGFFQGLWSSISGAFSTAVGAIGGKLSEMWSTAKGWIDRIVNIFKGMGSSINAALKMIKFPHISVGSGSVSVMGKKVEYPKLNVDWYEKGGWVGNTGLAVVHEGEYVLSRDMIAGRQAIQAPISGGGSNITLGPVYVSNEMDVDSMLRRVSLAYKFDSSI